MIETETNVRVRYAETDQMGIVYHSHYLVWMEVGRIRMLEEIGIPYPDLEAMGYMLPVLEIGSKYHAPARFDDDIRIVCRIEERPSVRLRVDYTLWNGERKLMTSFSKHAFLSPENKPVKPPQAFEDVIAKYYERG